MIPQHNFATLPLILCITLNASLLLTSATTSPCSSSYTISTNQNSSITCLDDTDTTNCPRLSICFRSNCICRMGYQWDAASSSCFPHSCHTDANCYTYYPHTKCVDDACVCDDVSHFCPINQACVYLPSSANYMLAIFLMAGTFVAISVTSTVVTFWWTKRRYQRRAAGENGALVGGEARKTANYQSAETTVYAKI